MDRRKSIMENKPLEDKEVTCKIFDVQQYGTITVPTDREAHSAFIFVAGSGPTAES
jgi:hypothetical protein